MSPDPLRAAYKVSVNPRLGGTDILYERYREIAAVHDDLSDRLARAEQTAERMRNEVSRLIGLVTQAHADIERLNNDTPYRPGMIEKVTEELLLTLERGKRKLVKSS